MAEACELDVRELSVTDASVMAELYRGNPQYFEHTGEQPTEALARRDLTDLPDGFDPEKKRMYGFFRGGRLVALIDLLFGYPDDSCAYIGLFMVAREEQGRGIGSAIVTRVLGRLRRDGFHRVRLAYIEANSQSRGFWEHCGFKATGDTGTFNGGRIIAAQKELKMTIDDLAFDDRGLIPAVVQQYDTGEVLMVAWMNAESLRLTQETGTTWFWSRSRQELWNKGATSGNMQQVKVILADCDADTLLVKVDSPGPACHTGNRTCFFQHLGSAE